MCSYWRIYFVAIALSLPLNLSWTASAGPILFETISSPVTVGFPTSSGAFDGFVNGPALAVDFKVSGPTRITSIGGFFGVLNAGRSTIGGPITYFPPSEGNIWGGIVKTNADGTPSMDFTSPTASGILAQKVFNIPIETNAQGALGSVQVSTTLSSPLILQAGTYALVFAEGDAFTPALSNAHQSLFMTTLSGTPNITTGYSAWNGSGWQMSARINNNLDSSQFFAIGSATSAIPEPGSLALVGVGIAVVLCRVVLSRHPVLGSA